MHYCDYDSPLGNIMLASDGESITEIRFVPSQGRRDALAVFIAASKWLDDYFGGSSGEPDFKIRLHVPPFAEKVLTALCKVGYGETITYGGLSAVVFGSPRYARAVGCAVGSNPVAIAVPCHRVVAAKGLGGYEYGTAAKSALLDLERANITLK